MHNLYHQTGPRIKIWSGNLPLSSILGTLDSTTILVDRAQSSHSSLWHKEGNKAKAMLTDEGMHVGSGIAEAACKTVVDTRAKRASLRWTPDGLDAVLPLRTTKLNHTYDEFWEHQCHLSVKIDRFSDNLPRSQAL